MSLDIVGTQLAFSPGGSAGLGFAVQDQDAPSGSTAYGTLRSASGRLSSPIQIPGAQEVLAVGWSGRTLELLTGDSPAGEACCSSASVIGLGANGQFGKPHVITGGLAGATVGQLAVAGRSLLASVGTERGVWAAQSSGAGRWARTHRLAGAGGQPGAVQSVALAGGKTKLAWAGGRSGPNGPRSILAASGTARRVPDRARIAVTVGRGHGIDELALAPRGSDATLAWIESWYDRRGNYHSLVVAADASHPRRTTSFRVPGTIASGLAFGGDDNGDQVLSWAACTWNAVCSTRAVLRARAKGFGRAVRLGASDAGEAPAAAVSSRGHALVGWIGGGHVLARYARAQRFSGTHMVSATTFASNLAVAFGPPGGAVAAWSQGTFAPEIVGALYRG